MVGERDSQLVADREVLFAKYSENPSEDNRNAIAESFLSLAEFFAKRYKDRGADPEDLRQVAKMALVKAVDRFDPTLDVQFSTFAGRTIDGELKRYFRDKTWSVRVPRSLQERSIVVRRVADELAVRLGSAPTIAQISAETGLETDQIIEALDVQQSYRASSLDASSSTGDESSALSDRLASEDDAIERTDTELAISRLLDTLPEREREILQLRFFDELSQIEIAERVGVSQMHVSRLIRKALEDLRAQMGPLV